MIDIKLEGIRETIGMFNKVKGHLPVVTRQIELDISKDVQRGTRFRITKRFKRRTGRMWQSVLVTKFGKHWGVKAGGWTAPYFAVQEYGGVMPGYKFVWKRGTGKHDEGFMIPFPMTSIRRGKFPFTDAVVSARRRANIIAERRLKKLGELK